MTKRSNGFDIRRHLPSTAFVLIALLAFAGFGSIFIYAGVYNIAADAPHSRLVYDLLHQLRERSVERYASDVIAPSDLDDPKRIAAGAGLYAEMCAGCHLGPGLERSELAQGLYPQAPELSRGTGRTPAQQFWIIKHGVKLSAMPAWGKTHDDQLIWDMVAFIQKLPQLDAGQYQAAVKSAPADHDEMMGHMSAGNPSTSSAEEPGHEHTHSH